MSLAVVLLVSGLGKVSREEQVYRMQLHRVPESELDPARTRVTRKFPLVMAAYGIAIFGIFMIWYIRPFRQATGTDALGEIVVLSAGPLLWVGTTLFAWWMIRRSYGK